MLVVPIELGLARLRIVASDSLRRRLVEVRGGRGGGGLGVSQPEQVAGDGRVAHVAQLGRRIVQKALEALALRFAQEPVGVQREEVRRAVSLKSEKNIETYFGSICT